MPKFYRRPPPNLSKNQQKKWIKANEIEMNSAAERGQGRYDTHGINYKKLAYAALSRIDGFGALKKYTLSESRSKWYRSTTTGWLIIMDLSKTYFRIQNPDEEYTDANGAIQPDRENNSDFLGRSHFKTR